MTRLSFSPRRWTTRSASVPARSMRVLVVDDNKNTADALAAYLESAALKALAVYGGIAAIGTSCIWKPDVVLLDISMPGVDGFTVANTLRANARTSAIVIVALTAHDESFVKAKAAEGDFDAYCQKGLVLDELSSLLLSLTHACEGSAPFAYAMQSFATRARNSVR
jgi:two-component system, OmpR family, response regulator